jgi:hypothetical protein
MLRLPVEFIPDPELGGYTAQIPGVPAYGEGPSKSEAVADLRLAFGAYVEEFGFKNTLAKVNRAAELQEFEFPVKQALSV